MLRTTNTTQEALKLALEALEVSTDWDVNATGKQLESMQAITALRKALAQPEQKPVGDDWTPCMKLPVVVYVRKQRLGESHVSTREGITPVKPDDLIMRGVSGEEYPIGRAIFEQTYSLNTAPPQRTEQEPVAHIPLKALEQIKSPMLVLNNVPIYGYSAEGTVAVYTTSPQRTFVGLSEDDKVLINHDANYNQFMTAGEYADRVQQLTEARLKDKNT